MALTTIKIHQVAPFFCSPGNPADFSDVLKKTYTSTTAAQPWPWGRALRVKILPGEKTFDVVVDIIKQTSLEWVTGESAGITLTWVSSQETADIRISFRPGDPNWSAWGPRALQYDQARATMNFSLGGWQDKNKQAIFSHAQIARVAAHLFGHALGLPHALPEWPSAWNRKEIVDRYGSFFAGVIESDVGSPSLQAPNSIMQFDRPLGFGDGSTSHEYRGGSQIDDEARNALQQLYPAATDVCVQHWFATDMFDFSAGIGEITALKYIPTPCTANSVSGFHWIDLGLTGNFRLRTWTADIGAGSSPGYRLRAGTWGDTQIHQVGASVLSFHPSDDRIQTGRETLSALAHNETLRAGAAGAKVITFQRPFSKPPQVVAWLNIFDTIKGKQLRVACSAYDIHERGFTLEIKTWADTIPYEIGATWLAHAADSPSLRSGTFLTPQRPQWTRQESLYQPFSTPLPRKPRSMFRAISMIDAHASNNIRVAYETPSWDEKGVNAVFRTWLDESKFDCVQGVYVAVF